MTLEWLNMSFTLLKDNGLLRIISSDQAQRFLISGLAEGGVKQAQTNV
jgi:hypothetical protein